LRGWRLGRAAHFSEENLHPLELLVGHEEESDFTIIG
jgi:hypothetical protein